MSVPRLSVILPVYNGSAYLAEAMESVLNQTFRDFELLVIDDASTDGSAAVAEQFNDPRVRVIRQETNRRLPATLNHGLDLARGEWVARMDADDICHPLRFEKQIRWMEKNPEIGICGTWVRLFGGVASMIQEYPVSPDAVEAFRHFHCPFAHPTVMMRKALLEEYKLRYDPAAQAVEDFDLWNRLLVHTRGMNIPEILLDYRLHEASVTTRDWNTMDKNSSNVLRKALKECWPDITEEQSRFHRQVSMAEIPPTVDSLQRAGDWLGKIEPALNRNRDARDVLREVWFRLAMRVAPSVGFGAIQVAFHSEFPRRIGLGLRQRLLIVGSATKGWARASK